MKKVLITLALVLVTVLAFGQKKEPVGVRMEVVELEQNNNTHSIFSYKDEDGKGDFGYNARTDKFENLFTAGVIDPTKVVRVALQNAASVAGMFLTTECALADIKEEQPAMPAMNPGMGGMM